MTSLNESVFYNCIWLSEVVIPDSVTVIDRYAFSRCTSLASISIPDGVISIGEHAFSDCISLASISIPDSVANIGECAFYSCTKLTSISIPNSVTSIGRLAFSATGYFEDANNWTDDVLYCDNCLLSSRRRLSGDYSILAGTFLIADNAFSSTGLTSVSIPNSVISIGNNAFIFCTSLKNVSISNSVTSIGAYAFYGCTSLTRVSIPESVMTIGDLAFYDCTSLTNISLSDRITRIGNLAFEGTGYWNEASNWTDDVLYCDHCLLTSRSTLSGDYSIMAGTLLISDDAFFATGLTNVSIPNSVISIGNFSFCSCTSLSSISIPNSVISIGKSAFNGCKKLSDVYYGGKIGQWNKIQISGDNAPLLDATIHFASPSYDIELGPTVDLSALNAPEARLTLTGPEDLEAMTVYGVRYSAEDQMLGLVSMEVQAGETGELTVPFADGSYIRFFALDAADQTPVCASVRVDAP